MRRGLLELCLIVIAIIGIHAERAMHSGSAERALHSGSIEGNIYPSSLSPSVVAVRGDDSVKSVSNGGHFGMRLQPGMWKVIFAAKNPNQGFVEKNVNVSAGQRIDLGQIKFTE
jgi:hypothetical protein